MKLVNRVSVFFLAALAVVLIVYSGGFYWFVRARLVHQFEQELRITLNSLVAAAEIEPEEVKWQPLEHTIALGAANGPDEIRWIVVGDGSQVVEKSRNAIPEFVARAQSIASSAANHGDGELLPPTDDWQVLHQRLVAPAPEHIDRELDEFDELVMVVARSTAPLNANLDRLLTLVCALPVATWLVAAVVGHWFCRRALQPVLDMAEQARSMAGVSFQSRLPTPQTADELADLAQAFNTLLDSQHRAFEQQRRFTDNAAHELRTPLTILLGQIDVALRRTRSPEEYEATLQLLRDQTSQMKTIVESLLFLARTEENANLPDSETFSLAEWLPDYIRRWKEHPRRTDIRLDTGDIGDSQIRASRARLLDNLVENALKYSSPGSRVDILPTVGNGEICLRVQDQGRGIAMEDQAGIFNPFFRSKAARDAGIAGTGLGLAIAARIAIASGGRLECHSTLGQGSCFTIRLPVAASALTD